jgi:hypothetical protein
VRGSHYIMTCLLNPNWSSANEMRLNKKGAKKQNVGPPKKEEGQRKERIWTKKMNHKVMTLLKHNQVVRRRVFKESVGRWQEAVRGELCA